MAACRRVLDQIIKRNFKSLRSSSWLGKRYSRTFTPKSQSLAPFSEFIAVHRASKIICSGSKRFYCAVNNVRELDELTFHAISDETLNVLMEYFEELGDLGYFGKDFDTEYADGVLTVRLGGGHGTYVLNKQTPNKQIWLSSPTSGPKRYDYTDTGYWLYRHDGVSLHELLSKEIMEATGQKISFTNLPHGRATDS